MLPEQTGAEVEEEQQESTGQEESQTPSGEETPQGSQEGKDELDNDQEFQKLVPQEFNKHPRFRQLYKKMKDAERNAMTLQEQLDSLSTQEEPELSDDELTQLAQKKGYQLTRAQQQAQQQMDDLEELFKQGTPQEREWWNKYNNAMMKKIDGRYSPMMQQVGEMLVEYRLEKSERMARKYIDQINGKYGLKLDFDKDVDPELGKMLKKNPRLNSRNTDILQLTRDFLAERGIELGKQLSAKEQQQLNKDKHKANMETPEVHKGGGVPDSNKSFSEILAEEMKKEGMTSWR